MNVDNVPPSEDVFASVRAFAQGASLGELLESGRVVEPTVTAALAGTEREAELAAAVARATAVIDEAYARYGGDEAALSLSFNGGKDCTVLLALIGAARLGHTDAGTTWSAAYLKSSNPFPVVESFIALAVAWSGVSLVEVECVDGGGMKASLEALLEAAPSIRAMWMGTRAGDPYSEHLESFTPTDRSWPKLMRVFPLLDWTYQEVWDFLRVFCVPFCVLYTDGYSSLGDIHNTNRNPKLVSDDGSSKPAWDLDDGSLERAGRP